MVKVILQLYPMLRAENEAERAAMRPMGRNTERYQEFLKDLPEICQAVDDLGIWGISTVEHHFHSEGYEVGPNPGIMATHMASLTKRARVGELGFTMSAQNPIRVAEDTALIDQITQGRSFVGFSRGYQARWTNVLGQHLGAKATLSPVDFSDQRKADFTLAELENELKNDTINRDVFEENVSLVIDAWTKDLLQHNSPRWQIPFPYESGIEWPMTDATSRLGAEGEIGADGRVHGVSVCPAPYNRPYPPVFIASNSSRETVAYAGRMGFNPTYFSPVSRAADYAKTYVEAGAEIGKQYAFGQNQALVRWPQIEETTEAAHQAIRDYDVEIYKNLYRPLTPQMPFDESDPVSSVLSTGIFTGGSVSEVRDNFISEWTELPAEYAVLIYHYPQMPAKKVIESLERFVKGVKPSLDDMTDHYPATV